MTSSTSTNGTSRNQDNPMDKVASESAARMEQMFDELQKFQEAQHQRAVEMIDEGARMMKASVEYGMKLSDEWRKIALQANRQASEMFTTKWF